MRATSKTAFAPRQTDQRSDQADRTRPLPSLPFRLAGFVLPLAALAIGLLSLTTARESAIGQYGLIQALPPWYFLSLAILAASFVMAWRSPRPHHAEFLLSLIILVVLLQGAPGIIESEPRFPSAWLHAGYTDFVAQTGRLLPNLDARFDWPSFFTGMALLDRTAGLPNAIILLRWWPVAINLLYLPPLYLLSKLLLRDTKKAMLALWLFPLANWIGQDYYSPQAVAYLLYLVLLCVVLGPYGANRRAMIPRRRNKLPDGQQEIEDNDGPPQAPLHVVTLLLVMLLLCGAMDTGHQLTPFFAIGTVAVLVFFGRTRLLAWPGVMLLLAIGWVCYGATDFWSGHFTALFGGLFSAGSNYSRDLRVHGDAAHSQIDDVRLLIVGGITALAILGFFASRKVRADRIAAAVIMLVPLFVIAGQSYGSEAGLRAFLFSLPGALPLVAVALTSARAGLRPVFISAFTVALIPGFLIARWGNELSEMVRPAEISGMNALYAIAPPGATMMSITPQVTWQYKDVGKYQYSPDNLDEFAFGSISAIAAHLHNPAGGYVIITTGELEYAQAAYGLPATWGTDVEKKLEQSRSFRLIYANSAAEIFQYIGIDHVGH
jgi:hypothetical protein